MPEETPIAEKNNNIIINANYKKNGDAEKFAIVDKKKGIYIKGGEKSILKNNGSIERDFKMFELEEDDLTRSLKGLEEIENQRTSHLITNGINCEWSLNGEVQTNFVGGNTTSQTFEDNVPQGIVFTFKNIKIKGSPVIYKGEVNQEGKQHGKGTLGCLDTFNKQTVIYNGDWKDGLYHGEGTLYYPSLGSNENQCDKYAGSWVKNQREGEGTMTYLNGETYNGQWVKNQRHGKGTITTAQGVQYELHFKKDKIDFTQKGKIKYPDGEEYIGNLKMIGEKIMKHGEGVLTTKDKIVYRGEFKEDKRDGEGILSEGGIEIYNGIWKDDKRNGKGTGRSGEMEYKGNWKDDQMEDENGELTFIKVGEKYKGSFKGGVMTGKGDHFDKDGNKRYSGDFVEGYYKGDGILIDSIGMYTGQFEKGEFNGDGKFKYSNGSVYVGKWKDGKKNGKGTLTTNDGSEFDGIFEDDQFIRGSKSF